MGALSNGIELLADETDPEMREKCLELLAQNAKVRDQLGEMGRSRVLAKFSLERMVDRYSELYLEVALKAALHSKGRT